MWKYRDKGKVLQIEQKVLFTYKKPKDIVYVPGRRSPIQISYDVLSTYLNVAAIGPSYVQQLQDKKLSVWREDLGKLGAAYDIAMEMYGQEGVPCWMPFSALKWACTFQRTSEFEKGFATLTVTCGNPVCGPKNITKIDGIPYIVPIEGGSRRKDRTQRLKIMWRLEELLAVKEKANDPQCVGGSWLVSTYCQYSGQCSHIGTYGMFHKRESEKHGHG